MLSLGYSSAYKKQNKSTSKSRPTFSSHELWKQPNTGFNTVDMRTPEDLKLYDKILKIKSKRAKLVFFLFIFRSKRKLKFKREIS